MPLGQDSVEQSRTPLPKSMLVHRQVMLLLGQPKPGALFNMFWIQFFCLPSVNEHSIAWARRGKTYAASRQAVDGTEILSQAEACEQGRGEEEVLHCEWCCCGVDWR